MAWWSWSWSWSCLCVVVVVVVGVGPVCTAHCTSSAHWVVQCAGLALSCRHVFAQHTTDALYRSESFQPDGPLTTARQLDSIAVPVSVVVGERDRGFKRASEFMQQKIPGAVLREVAGAGHMACEKDPEQFNKVSWLAGLVACVLGCLRA